MANNTEETQATEQSPAPPMTFKDAHSLAETQFAERENLSPLETEALETEVEVSTEQQSEDTEEAADPAEETAEDEEIPLLTETEQAEWSNLSTPEEQRTYMNRAFTQKTQDLAAQRTSLSEEQEKVTQHLSELEEWSQIKKGWETDPRGLVEMIAPQLDLTVTRNNGPQSTETKTETAAPEISTDLTQMVRSVVQEDLGEQGMELVPVITKVASIVANHMIQQRIEPLEQDALTARQVARRREVVTTKEQLTQKYGESWKKHETVIAQKMHEWPKGDGMSHFDHANACYQLISGGQQQAAKTATQMVKNVRKAEAKSEPVQPGTGVASKTVVEQIPKNPKMREAWEAAKKGIRWGTKV